MNGPEALLERDLELARRVHYSMLPEPFADGTAEVGLAYAPAARVGGDFCHVNRCGDRQYFASVSDVTGHGVAAALLVTRTNSFVRQALEHHDCPGRLVQALNRFLCDHFSDLGLYLSFFAAFLDLDAGEVRACGAGHPPAFLVAPGGSTRRIESRNPPVGIYCSTAPALEVSRDPLHPGDACVMITDGTYEMRGEDNQGRLSALEARVGGLAEKPAQQICEAVLETVPRRPDGSLDDDALVMALRLR
jgi:serine phosphatase RsbU (regulator of sigma subunit)